MTAWESVLAEHLRVVESLRGEGELLDEIAAETIAALRAGRRVYAMGNGGSAADAQHIATELLGRFKHDRNALPAVALTTDTSGLTAIGNDLGFDQVFARQVEGLVGEGDVVWALSTSGNSPNILHAVARANQQGAFTVGFTGESGGKLGALCRLTLRVSHTGSDRIQEAHSLAYHYLCERIEEAFL